MQLFLLGAGRPENGGKPTALKNITLKTKAMDWQSHSFESTLDLTGLDEFWSMCGSQQIHHNMVKLHTLGSNKRIYDYYKSRMR